MSLRERLPSTAGVAQLVEHLICNQRVGGSNPFASSMKRIRNAGQRRGGGTIDFPTALHKEAFPSVVFSRGSMFARDFRSSTGQRPRSIFPR